MTVPWFCGFTPVYHTIEDSQDFFVDGVAVVLDPKFAFEDQAMHTLSLPLQPLLTPGTAQVVCVAEEATAGRLFEKVK